MSDRISFIPVCNSLDNLFIQSKCRYCKVLTEKIEKTLCFGCNKYLQHIKENDILMISYKPFWIHIGQNKDEYRMSWFDFLDIEEQIQDFTDKSAAIFYDKNNLFYYLDFNILSSNQKEIVEIFESINNFINQEFILNNNEEKKLNHNFSNIFQSLIETNLENKFLFLSTDEAKKSLNPSTFTASRKKIMNIFKEKFEFNNECC